MKKLLTVLGAMLWIGWGETPNIIYIFADDMGYGDVTAYNPESKIPTPFMDRLVTEGMKFTDAHSVSGVCTPSRYGVLTGRYAWRTSLKSGVLWGGDPALIEPGRLTVAGMLKEKGYTTALFGKWHLGIDWEILPQSEIDPDWVGRGQDNDYTVPFGGGPLDNGFDWFYGIHASLDMEPYAWLLNDQATGNPTDVTNTGGRTGRTVPGFEAVDVLPELTDSTVAYIRRHVETAVQEPFFIYFPLPSPHTPVRPTPEFDGISEAGSYGDFMVQTDWTVGQVMNILDTMGIADNTLFIVTSDNGPETSMKNRKTQFDHFSSGEFRGMKRDLYEGGHRVPFIARWPGVIEAGSVSSEIISLSDLIATVAAIVEYDLPVDAGEDSYSILPALLGLQGPEPIREATVHHSSNGSFAIRQGDWKFIEVAGSGGSSQDYVYEGPDGQLYNMSEDTTERNESNEFLSNTSMVDSLTGILDRYRDGDRSTPLVRDDLFYSDLVSAQKPGIHNPPVKWHKDYLEIQSTHKVDVYDITGRLLGTFSANTGSKYAINSLVPGYGGILLIVKVRVKGEHFYHKYALLDGGRVP